jgi:hypothetical protein
MVRTQLERAGTPVEIRDNFLRLFSCLAVSILFCHFAQYKTGGLWGLQPKVYFLTEILMQCCSLAGWSWSRESLCPSLPHLWISWSGSCPLVTLMHKQQIFLTTEYNEWIFAWSPQILTNLSVCKWNPHDYSPINTLFSTCRQITASTLKAMGSLPLHNSNHFLHFLSVSLSSN